MSKVSDLKTAALPPSGPPSVDEDGDSWNDDPQSEPPEETPATDSTELPSIALGSQTFKLGKLLGRGGMAEVFVAHKVGPADFARKVVIKKILPERSSDQTYVQRFLREASLAAQLHHPNIVEILELGQFERSYYIVMEYVDGRNLHDLLRRLRKAKSFCPPVIAARVVADVASALDYAHNFVGDDGQRRRIVHRDVSTTNIMVSFSGIVKLVDFGVAKDLNAASLTVGDHIIGKPLYLPPESLRGGKPTLSWDIYALGLVLYKLLAGRAPFDMGKGPQGLARLVGEIANKVPAPPRQFNQEVPPELERIAMRALEKNPLDRQASAAEVQQELETFLLGQAPISSTVMATYLSEVFDRAPPSAEMRLSSLPKTGSAPITAPPVETETAPPQVAPGRDPWAAGDEPRKNRSWLVGLVAGVVLVVAGLVAWQTGPVQRFRAAWLAQGQKEAPGPAEPVEPTPVRPVVESGTLVVRCSSWGFVAVAGKQIGTCPLDRPTRLPAGEYRVTLEVNQRLTERRAKVAAGETTVIDFDVPVGGGGGGRKTPVVINPTPR